MHSKHIFIFPFIWQGKSSKLSFEEIDHAIDFDFWESYHFSFKIDSEFNTYNTHQYFYEAVRDVLNLETSEGDISTKLYQYKQLNSDATYRIFIKGLSYSLDLHIVDILLGFYKNGVGYFIFNLTNTNYADHNTILKINDYGRRIFPQFLGYSTPSYTDATKYSFLADRIVIDQVKLPFPSVFAEDFSFYDSFDGSQGIFNLPNHIKCFLGEKFCGDEQSDAAIIHLRPILDDRMYVMCYYFNTKLLDELKQYNEVKEIYGYQESRLWYRYVYVDGSSPSCESKTMLKKQLTENSYDRWIEKVNDKHQSEGQLFGVSRYSFVVLVADCWFTRTIISRHFENMYLSMVLLCLIQRCNVVVFGNKVARIARLFEKSDNINQINEQASRLYLEYLKFVNKIYFREISPQEQGIELYAKLQQVMQIKEHVADLDKEIMELNNYIETIEQNKLSKVAGLFLPVTLFAGLLGVNTFKADSLPSELIILLNTILIGWFFYVIYRQYIKKN